MPLNEADTRGQLIDPQLNGAGWTRSQVTREHYYRTDLGVHRGQDRAARGLPPNAFHLNALITSSATPTACPSPWWKPKRRESRQWLACRGPRRTRDLGLAFAFATNGHEIIEWDAFTDSTRLCERFPTPEELWNRWQLNTGQQEPAAPATRQVRPVYSVDTAQHRRNPLYPGTFRRS